MERKEMEQALINSNLLMADVFLVLKIIMGPKAETYAFNQVKELLRMHENTLLNVFNSTMIGHEY